MRRRRLNISRAKWLGATALAIASFDVWFVWQRLSPSPVFSWTISMPELERSQVEHPDNFLTGSENWDPRLPPSSVIDPAFDPTRPSMLRSLLACRPKALVVEDVRLDGPEMPTRFYLSGSDRSLAKCAGQNLPLGYSITEGILPR